MSSGRRPTKAELEQLRRELSMLPRGRQQVVRTGIYARLDGNGNLRFQLRERRAGRGSTHQGQTFTSFDEALRAQREAKVKKANGSPAARRAEMGRMKFERYARDVWWEKTVLANTDPRTWPSYRGPLENDMIPFWKGMSLNEILENEELIEEYYDVWLKERKIIDRGRRKGEPARAARQRAFDIFLRCLEDAVNRGVIPYNPASRVRKRRNQRLRRSGVKGGTRPVRQREVQHPVTMERVRLNMLGRGQFLREYRAIVTLGWAIGLRPECIVGLRHQAWRTPSGPRKMLVVDRAVSDVCGKLIEGLPKSGEREAYLWPVVAEELEALYQEQGCPPLSSLVFPSSKGSWIDWNNWRGNNWYRALHRAGLIEEPRPGCLDGFDCYSMRHTCATLMFYAVKPDGTRYTVIEIARHLGNTPEVLLAKYAGVLEDLHGYAGNTMDEIIRLARREVWGPGPGDPDYEEEWYKLAEAERLTGTPAKLLDARIRRGSLAARHDGRFRLISRWHLVWAGLLAPASGPAVDLRRAA